MKTSKAHLSDPSLTPTRTKELHEPTYGPPPQGHTPLQPLRAANARNTRNSEQAAEGLAVIWQDDARNDQKIENGENVRPRKDARADRVYTTPTLVQLSFLKRQLRRAK